MGVAFLGHTHFYVLFELMYNITRLFLDIPISKQLISTQIEIYCQKLASKKANLHNILLVYGHIEYCLFVFTCRYGQLGMGRPDGLKSHPTEIQATTPV